MNMVPGSMGVFTFGPSTNIFDHLFLFGDISDTHTMLPIPTMFGERHFNFGAPARAVLNTGEATDLAVEYLLETFGHSASFDNPWTVIRPSEEMITSRTTLDMFEKYVSIVENVNTMLQLPMSVTMPIQDAVDSLLHGVLTIDATVDRIADIMWLYMNE